MNKDEHYEEWKEYIEYCLRVWIKRTSPHLFQNIEDHISNATLAYLECLQKYDSALPFKPYLKASIFNKLTDVLRSEIKYQRIQKDLMETPYKLEDSSTLSLSYENSEKLGFQRFIPQDEEEVYTETIWDIIEKCQSITHSDRRFIRVCMNNEGSPVAVAKKLMINPSTVWRKYNRIVEKLQEFVGESV